MLTNEPLNFPSMKDIFNQLVALLQETMRQRGLFSSDVIIAQISEEVNS